MYAFKAVHVLGILEPGSSLPTREEDQDDNGVEDEENGEEDEWS